MPTHGMSNNATTPIERENQQRQKWRSFFGRDSTAQTDAPLDKIQADKGIPTRWSMGVLNDRNTHEVPGSVLLLTGYRNEPLGLRNAPARTSSSTLPQQLVSGHNAANQSLSRRLSLQVEKKKTPDGTIILEPQPDDSHNDPLNWPAWRRDSALISLGLYCMVGGGMTPILAAGFTNVASTYNVIVPQVALTTGLYMMGMGLGSVVASPTAILWGKRPVYLTGCILFIVTSVWCAISPNYGSLVAARIFQGFAVSPVECLPSATIAEIFFLHERAYRIGIYTLLLLGGKNLVPLVSAAVIQSLEWRWVFWICAMVGGFCWMLLFFFVPETFWDRTPRPKNHRKHLRGSTVAMFGSRRGSHEIEKSRSNTGADGNADDSRLQRAATSDSTKNSTSRRISTTTTPRPRVEFATEEADIQRESASGLRNGQPHDESSDTGKYMPTVHIDGSDLFNRQITEGRARSLSSHSENSFQLRSKSPTVPAHHKLEDLVQPGGNVPPTPLLHNINSPFYTNLENKASDYLDRGRRSAEFADNKGGSPPLSGVVLPQENTRMIGPPHYTSILMDQPRQSFVQQLKPYNGRLHDDNWFKVAFRPFILLAYPAVLWSSVIYSCSVGWLIVLSESVAVVYRNTDTYNFSALSTGLIYLSPFIGGILGTAVAGKVSDVIVRAMSRHNGGLYEPEFRLVMAIPVSITTVIGLMGFGWSAEVHDNWMVPTVFFGIISFGCSLGSTTAITFCVDSYRQYAGEALVTLNFCKNILHGLVFSLFLNRWLEADGTKTVFIALGCIQLIFCLLTVPMYIWGKRARMWTVRMNFMEKF